MFLSCVFKEVQAEIYFCTTKPTKHDSRAIFNENPMRACEQMRKF